MSKTMISQALMWAAAIIVNSLDTELGWLWLTVLATMALGALNMSLKGYPNQSG